MYVPMIYTWSSILSYSDVLNKVNAFTNEEAMITSSGNDKSCFNVGLFEIMTLMRLDKGLILLGID